MHWIPNCLNQPQQGHHIHDLETRRDLHCPAPNRPADPMLNAAGTTENLSSALGTAGQRSSGSYPVWLMAHTGLFD